MLEQIQEKLCQEKLCQVTSRCSVDPTVRKGNAAEQIVEVARDGNYDLLVIGAETSIAIGSFRQGDQNGFAFVINSNPDRLFTN